MSIYIFTTLHLYTIVICRDGTILDGSVFAIGCYVWHVVGWVYLTCDVCLCEYYVIIN